ncbi:MAG: mannose-6-phosphate isomerase [Candidatus Promineifilaceae bacterium]|jgi:mannose-6-phosphate isomerase
MHKQRTRPPLSNAPLYPLTFSPLYQDYIWGGTRMQDTLGRRPETAICAESWDVSDRPEGQSVVSNGALEGTTLRHLMQSRRRDLVGALKADVDVFPLLIKIIDANKTLSIQVHPDDASAAQHGGEAKTEMWYVLDADTDACVYAGFKAETTADAFKAAIHDGMVADVLQKQPVRPGDVVFIPGGRIHAIGAGCLILEIQQNSNTTYRVDDWGRLGVDGKPRDLHLDAASRVINWTDTASPMQKAERLGRATREREEWRLLSCDHFYLGQINMSVPTQLSSADNTFEILFCKSGTARIAAGETVVDLAPATSCLIPANVTEYTLSSAVSDTAASVMRILPGPYYMDGQSA